MLPGVLVGGGLGFGFEFSVDLAGFAILRDAFLFAFLSRYHLFLLFPDGAVPGSEGFGAAFFRGLGAPAEEQRHEEEVATRAHAEGWGRHSDYPRRSLSEGSMRTCFSKHSGQMPWLKLLPVW